MTADPATATPTPVWHSMRIAPKRDAQGRAVHFLAWCPDEATPYNMDAGICVCWWEDDRRAWFGEGGFELRPASWTPLPAPPVSGRNSPLEAVGR